VGKLKTFGKKLIVSEGDRALSKKKKKSVGKWVSWEHKQGAENLPLGKHYPVAPKKKRGAKKTKEQSAPTGPRNVMGRPVPKKGPKNFAIKEPLSRVKTAISSRTSSNTRTVADRRFALNYPMDLGAGRKTKVAKNTARDIKRDHQGF